MVTIVLAVAAKTLIVAGLIFFVAWTTIVGVGFLARDADRQQSEILQEERRRRGAPDDELAPRRRRRPQR